MSIIDTSAKLAYDADGDPIGYALPDVDPISISIEWTKSYRTRPFEDNDDYFYLVTWPCGTWAKMFTISNEWQAIVRHTIERERKERLARLDAALAEAAKPLTNTVTTEKAA